MNQNSNLSPKVLTEGFFKTRVRRPVIWEVKRREADVSAEGEGHSNPNRARTVSKSDLEQSKSESDYLVWRVAA